MAKPLGILYVSSEAYPFIKISGIGDVSYSLPLALRELGHDVRVMFPKYGIISERKNKIHEISRLRDVPISIGDNVFKTTVKSSSMYNSKAKLQAYITTNYEYFDSRKGIYLDPKTNKPFPDNDERFLFFCKTAIETCLVLNWFPDIIHCNDWQTAIISAFVKTLFPSKFRKTKVILTIHNASDQGIFPAENFSKTGLPQQVMENFIHKDNLNFLKGGIVYADYITTVSPTYRNEILQDANHTNGLNELLLQKQNKFEGILNGIDPYQWNPRIDKHIIKNFTNDFSSYKEANKEELLTQFGLEYNPEVPVFAMISKLDYNKGISLLLEALDSILKMNIKFVLLGDGENEYKKKLKKLADKYKDKFGLKLEYDEKLAHLIEAGSDFFLMPSIYEPCGLNSMYSLAYGSIPIVRATGGLIDIVNDIDIQNKTGNGIVFREPNKDELINAVKRAIEIYNNKELREEICLNNMKQNYSWGDKAKRYEEIYYTASKE